MMGKWPVGKWEAVGRGYMTTATKVVEKCTEVKWAAVAKCMVPK